ncbi:MAG: YrhB domain-containing protein [Pyrinomonadaceae bacterium]
MLNKEAARQLALAHITQDWDISDSQPVILDDVTIERDFGWVFFYDSSKHQETGEFMYAIAGNAPIIVNKHDGSIHITGTGRPTEDYIKAYEETGDPHAHEVRARQQ